MVTPELGARVVRTAPGHDDGPGTVIALLGTAGVGGGAVCRVRWDSGSSTVLRPDALEVVADDRPATPWGPDVPVDRW